MNVVPFTPATARSLRSWTAHELEALLSVYESHAAHAGASSWDVGATEFDDPQFYVLGPAPDLDCLVAISRVGRVYVLENGTGQVLDEGTSLQTLAARAKAAVARGGPISLLARITLGLMALRLAVEERIEQILVESEELMLRFAPQLAMMI
jgi:hypothetical protein